MKNYLSGLALGAHAIGLLITFYFTYKGFAYILNNNFLYSLLAGVIITFGLALLVNLMIKGKHREKNGRPLNNGFTAIEGISLLLYAGVASVAFYATAHCINVEFLLKDKIRQSVYDKYEELEQMVVDYKDEVEHTGDVIQGEMQNHLNRYKLSRRYALADSLRPYGISAPSPDLAEMYVRNSMDANRTRAMSTVSSTTDGNTNFINETKYVFDNWNSDLLQSTLTRLDDRLESNLDMLKTNFKSTDANNVKWNNYSFDFIVSPREDDLVSNPSKLKDKYNPSWIPPALAAFFINLFVLLIYFLEGRDGRRRLYPRGRKNLENIGRAV